MKKYSLYILSFFALVGIAYSLTADIYCNQNKSIPILFGKTDSFQLVINLYSKQLVRLDSCQKTYDTARLKMKENSNHLVGIKRDREVLLKQNEEFVIEMMGNGSTDQEIDSIKKLEEANLLLIKKIDAELNSEQRKIDSLESCFLKTSSNLYITKKEFTGLYRLLQTHAQQVKESRRIIINGVTYLIFVADLNKHHIALHLQDTSGRHYNNIENLYKSLKKSGKDPLMITNAGMFVPGNNPQGLYIEWGKGKLHNLDLSSPETDGNFYLKPNGVFYIDSANRAGVVKTDDFVHRFEEPYTSLQLATQSGPMLVINGRLHPAFKYGSSNIRIRSGVGVMSENKVVFIASENEVNFYEFAQIFKNIFHCSDALYLDGAISLMYLHDKNKEEKGGHFGPMISITKRK